MTIDIHQLRKRIFAAAPGLARRAQVGGLLRNPLVRYVALALAAAFIMIAALSPLASIMVEEWSQRDIELRSQLVFRSIRDQVASGIAAKPDFDPLPFFERLAEDERILALGFCTSQGQLRYATKLLPKPVTCGSLKLDKETFKIVTDAGRRIHVGAFPITTGTVTGHLLVLHDLTYADARAKQARFYSVLALVGVAAGLGLLATSIMLALMRGWTRSNSHRHPRCTARRAEGTPARRLSDEPRSTCGAD